MRLTEPAGDSIDGVALPVPWDSRIPRNHGVRRESSLPSPKPRVAQRLLQEVATLRASCGAFEWVALTYLAFTAAGIIVFARHLAHPALLFSIQTLLAAFILLLCRADKRSSERQAARGNELGRHGRVRYSSSSREFWRFWRSWYPHLFFLFCFEELGRLVHLITPGWQDASLIAFDYWLTGVHPAAWLERFATPGLNDFMQFTYITYFAYLLVLGGILYARNDERAYWSVMTYSAVAYIVGYVIAILFPIESPWFAMAGMWHGPLRGGAFTAVINFIEHYGRVRGAAFPSEHVAGSVAALWGAWRHRRWLFWTMLPLVLCMCVSTVYGRYHYVADVFAGIVTGTLGYVIGAWLMTNRGALPRASQPAEERRQSVQFTVEVASFADSLVQIAGQCASGNDRCHSRR